jgi:tetratricopeptide (TPR) repeat protein
MTIVLGVFAALFVFPAAADDTKDADLFTKAGGNAYREGDIEKALKQLEMALQCDPTHPGATQMLVKVYAKTLEPHKIVELYENWLKAYKRLRDPMRDRMIMEDRIKADLESLVKLVEIEKEYAKKFVALGARVKYNDKEAAIGFYGMARFLDPTNASIKRVHNKLTGGGASDEEDAGIGELEGIHLGRCLTEDDFSKESNHWKKTSKASYQDNQYVITSGKYITNIRFEEGCKPADFYAEAEVRYMGKGKASDTMAAGICFRIQDPKNYYVFMVSTNGKLGLWIVKNGIKLDMTGKEDKGYGSTTFGCCEPDPTIGRYTSMNILSVAMVNEKIICYVDRKPVFRCEDDRFSKGGKIGLTVNGGSHQFGFDNFKVFAAVMPK